MVLYPKKQLKVYDLVVITMSFTNIFQIKYFFSRTWHPFLFWRERGRHWLLREVGLLRWDNIRAEVVGWSANRQQHRVSIALHHTRCLQPWVESWSREMLGEKVKPKATEGRGSTTIQSNHERFKSVSY